MPTAAHPRPGGGGHPRWTLALAVLGGILTLLAVFSIWINRQALNTDNWVATSDDLIQNEAIRGQLSNFLADRLFESVDVRAEVEAALPPKLAPLAGPAAGGLEQVAPQIAERLLASAQFQTLWEGANRTAHEALLRILDGGGAAVSTEGGNVTLDLGSALEGLSQRFGTGGALAAKLPPDAAEITVLESQQLSVAQDVAKLVRRLPIVLALLAIICFAASIFLAGPRRREALRSVGFAFVAAGLLALVVRSFAGSYVVDGLTRVSSAEPAVEAAWSIGTSLLVTVASSAIVFGLLLVLGAWLAGSSRPAVELRRFAAPHVARSQAGTYGAAALLYLLLIAWAPIAAFRKPLGVLVFALLFAAGTELWRRQVLAEDISPNLGDAQAERPA